LERRAQKIAQIFLDRDLEMKRLEGHLENMLGGGGNLVFLAGEAGMGKSSLAERFISSTHPRHPELLATARAALRLAPKSRPNTSKPYVAELNSRSAATLALA
jgi:predicted ATP-dependent serine protease